MIDAGRVPSIPEMRDGAVVLQIAHASDSGERGSGRNSTPRCWTYEGELGQNSVRCFQCRPGFSDQPSGISKEFLVLRTHRRSLRFSPPRAEVRRADRRTMVTVH
jgi:hypothetical protein